MNGILLFSKDRAQHLQDISEFYSTLSAADLRLDPSKCKLYKEEVTFFSNLVLSDINAIFWDKTKLTFNFRAPKKIRSPRIPQLCQYFVAFCRDISQILALSGRSQATFPLCGKSLSSKSSISSSLRLFQHLCWHIQTLRSPLSWRLIRVFIVCYS